MSLSTQGSTENEDYVFIAQLDNARTMANILKAIHFKEVGFIERSVLSLKIFQNFLMFYRFDGCDSFSYPISYFRI